jgi:hypothetical protein
MNRQGRILFGASSTLFAIGIAFVGTIPLVPAQVFGAFFLALTIVLLTWRWLALRAYRGSGVLRLSRGPWLVIVGLILIEAVCALDLLAAPIGGDRVWLFLGYYLFIILYAVFLPSALLFWVADDTHLSVQLLGRKKAFLWHEIDWLYIQQNETTYKQGFIPIARFRDEQLVAEAGPRRRLEVVIRTPLAGGQASPMLQVIQARATNAFFGIDKLPAVQARRRGLGPGYAPQPEPNVSLQDAVEIARGEMTPATWTRFSVRRGVLWYNLISFPMLALVGFGGAAFVFLSGTVIGLGLITASLLEGPQKELVLIGEALLLIGFGVWMLSIALRWLRTLRRPQDYFFLITPRYIAEVRDRKVDGVALANVRSIHRSGGGYYGWKIVLDLKNGKQHELDVGANYAPPRDLFAYILAALDANKAPQPAAPFGPAMSSDSEM